MATLLQKAKFGAQVSYDSSTGNSTYQAFSGTVADSSAIIIFDNQSTAVVTISDNGTTDGKTFAVGEALVIDEQANKNNSGYLSWPAGTQFYAKSSAGVGNFYISWVKAV